MNVSSRLRPLLFTDCFNNQTFPRRLRRNEPLNTCKTLSPEFKPTSGFCLVRCHACAVHSPYLFLLYHICCGLVISSSTTVRYLVFYVTSMCEWLPSNRRPVSNLGVLSVGILFMFSSSHQYMSWSARFFAESWALKKHINAAPCSKDIEPVVCFVADLSRIERYHSAWLSKPRFSKNASLVHVLEFVCIYPYDVVMGAYLERENGILPIHRQVTPERSTHT